MKIIYGFIIIIGLFTGSLISQTIPQKDNFINLLEQFSTQNKLVNANKANIENFFTENNFLVAKILPEKIFISYQLYSNEEVKNINLVTLSINLDEITDYKSFVDNIKNKSNTLNSLYNAKNVMAFIDVKNDNSEIFINYYFDNSVSSIDSIKTLQHFMNTFQIYNS